MSVGRALIVQHELQRLALEGVQGHSQTLHACQQALRAGIIDVLQVEMSGCSSYV